MTICMAIMGNEIVVVGWTENGGGTVCPYSVSALTVHLSMWK
jgi:hypothetical protein